MPAVLFAAYAKESHDHLMAEAQETLRRRAALLAEHVARAFDTQAMMLDVIEAKLEGRDFAAIDRDPAIPQLLRELVERSPMVTALSVLDDQGTVIAANLPKAEGLPSATRDYFVGAIDSRPYLGEQIIGRASDRPVFSLSRRRAEGGVIAAMLDRAYFAGVFAALSQETAGDGPIALFRADGKQLARFPELAQAVILPPGSNGLMARMPEQIEGTYRGFSLSERSRERLYGFRKVPGYPAWVVHGRELGLIKDQWARAIVPQALLSLAAAALLMAASIWVQHREREADQVEAHLEQVVAERTAEAEQRAAEATEAAATRELALRAAQRADEAKSRFLASASHDLRQPIQGVRLFLDVLERRLVNSDDQQVLGLAVEALEGAEDLLSTLLDVSTLEAGIVTASLREVALGPMLQGLADEFAVQAAASGLRLKHVPSSLWGHTDPVLLARILRNLLTNAVRYTGSGTVLLGCRRTGRQLRIEVWDTGPGIPPDKQETVFDDFVQLGNPERDRAKGLGLGLAVARRMAALMGHSMGVVSAVGRGTVFWVTLPIIAPIPIATSEESTAIAV